MQKRSFILSFFSHVLAILLVFSTSHVLAQTKQTASTKIQNKNSTTAKRANTTSDFSPKTLDTSGKTLKVRPDEAVIEHIEFAQSLDPYDFAIVKVKNPSKKPIDIDVSLSILSHRGDSNPKKKTFHAVQPGKTVTMREQVGIWPSSHSIKIIVNGVETTKKLPWHFKMDADEAPQKMIKIEDFDISYDDAGNINWHFKTNKSLYGHLQKGQMKMNIYYRIPQRVGGASLPRTILVRTIKNPFIKAGDAWEMSGRVYSGCADTTYLIHMDKLKDETKKWGKDMIAIKLVGTGNVSNDDSFRAIRLHPNFAPKGQGYGDQIYFCPTGDCNGSPNLSGYMSEN